jgi:uncharacterized membrane protein
MRNGTVVDRLPARRRGRLERATQRHPRTVSGFASRRGIAGALVIAVVVLAGIAARGVNLGTKFWYHDEATTSLRVSGYDSGDARRALAGRVFGPNDAMRFQRVDGGRGLGDSLGSLAREDPQHPPAFYALARVWAASVSDSIVSLRALAALISLLALPAMFWLATELFGRGPERWITLALVAISPFQILYAQDAREYSLWAVTTAASSAALLRALRLQSARAWGIYALLLAVGLLADPLTAGVVLGHGAYLLIARRSELRRTLRPFAAALAAAGAAFAPWAYVMATHRGALTSGTDWTSTRIPLHALAKAWLVEAGLPFVDNAAVRQPFSGAEAALATATLALVVAGSIALRRRASRSSMAFAATLFAGSLLPLMLADVAFGGLRSTVPRFLVPVMLALELPVAFLLARWVRARARPARLFAALTCAGLLAAAAASFAASVSARVWWPHDDGAAAENLAVTRLLNERPQPFMLATGLGNTLEMVHYLRSDARIELADGARPPQLPAASAFPIYVYGSPTDGAPARLLTALLGALRSDSRLRLQPLTPRLPCCGAGIRQEPRQLWRVTIARSTRAIVASSKLETAVVRG